MDMVIWDRQTINAAGGVGQTTWSWTPHAAETVAAELTAQRGPAAMNEIGRWGWTERRCSDGAVSVDSIDVVDLRKPWPSDLPSASTPPPDAARSVIVQLRGSFADAGAAQAAPSSRRRRFRSGGGR
jgi:hypothetical protein